jgi:iron complex outermembrane recepter protein
MSHASQAGRLARRPVRRPAPLAMLLMFLTLVPLSLLPAQARVGGHLLLTITDGPDGPPLAAAVASLESRALGWRAIGGLTDDAGRVLLGPVPAGMARVVVRRIGYGEVQREVQITDGDTLRVGIALTAEASTLGTINVIALRGDLTPETRVDRERLAALAPHDAGDVLRQVAGADAVRRGGLALDPVVRGLRDTQLGVYVDAARTLPGGPAGMDTPLSHVDPAHIQTMEVISGPYALTWGAGNLSAIRVTTNPLPGPASGALRARLTSGYDSNLDAREVAGSIQGALGEGRLRYNASGAWRDGGDYTSGSGSAIQSAFRSSEGRLRLGASTSANGTLMVLGSVQAQRDIDYPGRPLDAAYFDSYHLQAEWSLLRPATRDVTAWALRDVDLMAYIYDVDHLMDNDDKPTALPDPQRMPPFPLAIATRSGVRVHGARVTARWVAPRGWEFEAGGDIYDADHDADRRVDRRDSGEPRARDLIWGGARILDAGLFTRAERPFGATRLAATARVDLVRADADSASAFFSQQYGEDRSSRETNWSGAVTWRVPVTMRWAMTAGLGSVVRTAEANERFSDRAPAKRAQTNADFLGDPRLRPERSTQADLWLEGRYARLDVQVNAFVRRMDDYITLEATGLAPRMGSPPTVFRFINGRADYVGGELVLRSALTPTVTLGGSLSALRGDDRTLDEPALGVTPLRADLQLRIAPPRSPWFIESISQLMAGQSRVATTRGEVTTPGWSTVDLQGGWRWRLTDGGEALLRVGVRNLLDRNVVHHLTALDAFTRGRIAEPGRVLFTRITLGW